MLATFIRPASAAGVGDIPPEPLMYTLCAKGCSSTYYLGEGVGGALALHVLTLVVAGNQGSTRPSSGERGTGRGHFPPTCPHRQ